MATARPPGRSERTERLLRALTFWLRPDFLLRCLNRFQQIAGFDRAMGLASSALTALIPLSILVSVVATQLGGKDTAQRIIDRYELTGGGAEAVRDIFSPATGTDTSLGIVGALFLLLAVLSFTRGLQRLIEQTWQLRSLGVRNSMNGLLWIGGLIVYVGAVGALHAVLDHGSLDLAANVGSVPVSAVFLVWSGWLLSAKRVPWRALVPFGAIAAVLLGLYGIGATVYVPHLFSTYATRYGVIGAVFAMISALFCLMVVTVASAAAGREVDEELRAIRTGRRPPDDEIRRQWDALISEARSRWRGVRGDA